MSTGNLDWSSCSIPQANASGCLQNNPTTKQQNKTMQYNFENAFETYIFLKIDLEI